MNQKKFYLNCIIEIGTYLHLDFRAKDKYLSLKNI